MPRPSARIGPATECFAGSRQASPLFFGSHTPIPPLERGVARFSMGLLCKVFPKKLTFGRPDSENLKRMSSKSSRG